MSWSRGARAPWSPCRISPLNWKQILDRCEIRVDFGGDEEPDNARKGGVDFVRGRWIRPAVVSDTVRVESASVLAYHEYLAAPAPESVIVENLLGLWHTMSHKPDLEWEVVRRYWPQSLLAVPLYCFRPSRFARIPAESGSDWIPEPPRLMRILAEDHRWILDRVNQLRELAVPPAAARPETMQERSRRLNEERRRREHEQLRAAMARQDAAKAVRRRLVKRAPETVGGL